MRFIEIIPKHKARTDSGWRPDSKLDSYVKLQIPLGHKLTPIIIAHEVGHLVNGDCDSVVDYRNKSSQEVFEAEVAAWKFANAHIPCPKQVVRECLTHYANYLSLELSIVDKALLEIFGKEVKP